jgi:hypothetical protein
MSDEGTARRVEELAQKAARARSWAKALRAETVNVARQVADTEHEVAETLAQLAAQRPHHAARLRALSQEAAREAARERRWGNAQSAGPVAGDDGAA